MAKTNKRYSFDPTILRLRLSNWERIVNTKLKVDAVRLHSAKIRDLELRIKAIETQLRPPKLAPTGIGHLAEKLRTKWGAK
jgi:hypothetical protein